MSDLGDESSALRTVIGAAKVQLSPEQTRMFYRLGLHPSPEFGVHAAAAVADVDLATAQQLCASLVDADLIKPAGPLRYRFDDVLHAHAADQVDSVETASTRRHALAALLTWYAQAAVAADELMFPGFTRFEVDLDVTAVPISIDDRAQALAWLNTEYPTLLAALRSAVSHSLYPLAIVLANSLRFLTFRQRELWTDRLDAESLGLEAAQASESLAAEKFLLIRRADTYMLLDRFIEADADLRRVLVLAQKPDDPDRRREALCGLGGICLKQERYAEAWDYYQQTLLLARSTQAVRSEAVVECNLSDISVKLGRFEEAFKHAERELELRRQAGDHMGEAYALYGIAVACQGLGKHDRAIKLVHRAATMYRKLGVSELFLALANEKAAISFEALGNLELAITNLREAIDLLTDLGDPRAQELQDRVSELESRVVRDIQE